MHRSKTLSPCSFMFEKENLPCNRHLFLVIFFSLQCRGISGNLFSPFKYHSSFSLFNSAFWSFAPKSRIRYSVCHRQLVIGILTFHPFTLALVPFANLSPLLLPPHQTFSLIFPPLHFAIDIVKLLSRGLFGTFFVEKKRETIFVFHTFHSFDFFEFLLQICQITFPCLCASSS